jgi:hypothetical protein
VSIQISFEQWSTFLIATTGQEVLLYCDVLPATRRIICGLRILYLNLSDVHHAELQLLVTLPI